MRARFACSSTANLFTRGDSREPEQAGIRGAVMGSLLTLILTLLLSLPDRCFRSYLS